jgi:hypothetical protein
MQFGCLKTLDDMIVIGQYQDMNMGRDRNRRLVSSFQHATHYEMAIFLVGVAPENLNLAGATILNCHMAGIRQVDPVGGTASGNDHKAE